MRRDEDMQNDWMICIEEEEEEAIDWFNNGMKGGWGVDIHIYLCVCLYVCIICVYVLYTCIMKI